MVSTSPNDPLVKQPHPVNQITPVSKYLALALFVILPFVGAYVGYQMALENDQNSRVVPSMIVNIQHENVQKNIKNKPQFSRNELFTREFELIKEYGLNDSDSSLGTAKLYFLKDENVPNELVPFEHKGLSLFLPYNPGWGSPYYSLTTFDINDNIVSFNDINPCPAGCMTSKGKIMGELSYSTSTIKHLVEKYLSDYQFTSCKEVEINDSVNGVYCSYDEMPEDLPILFVQGKEYVYGIKGLQCSMFNTFDNETQNKMNKEDDSCQKIANSIKIN